MKIEKTFNVNGSIAVRIDEIKQDKSTNIAFEFDGYNHMHFLVSGEIHWGDLKGGEYKVTKFEDAPVIDREMHWYVAEDDYDTECESEMEWIRDEYELGQYPGTWYSQQVLSVVKEWHD